jgi:hypothetical protein
MLMLPLWLVQKNSLLLMTRPCWLTSNHHYQYQYSTLMTVVAAADAVAAVAAAAAAAAPRTHRVCNGAA